MRLTIHLNDDLLAEARKAAAESGVSLSRLIEDSLRESLAQRKNPVRKRKVRLTTFGGHGLLPDVDLDRTSCLLDVMDSLDH